MIPEGHMPPNSTLSWETWGCYSLDMENGNGGVHRLGLDLGQGAVLLLLCGPSASRVASPPVEPEKVH